MSVSIICISEKTNVQDKYPQTKRVLTRRGTARALNTSRIWHPLDVSIGITSTDIHFEYEQSTECLPNFLTNWE